MLRTLRSLAGDIIRRSRFERDMTEELQFHLDRRTADLIASGLSPQEAARRARVEFGGVERYREECRDARRLQLVDHLCRDLRYAARMLHRNPTFTLIAIVTLALGIGANTAMFSVVRGVLLHPLPVDGIDRLVVIRSELPGLGVVDGGLTGTSTTDLGVRRDLFEHFGGWAPESYNLTSLTQPQRVSAARTVGDFFEVFKVRPYIGSLFTPEHAQSGRHVVAILSHGFWQRAFGGDRGVIGRKLELNAQGYEILGVLPPDFRYPRTVDIYVPMERDTRQYRTAMAVTAIGRIPPDTTATSIARRLETESPGWAEKYGIPQAFAFTWRALPFTRFYAGQLRPVLLVLLGAVGFVLLVTCANVAGLQLLRSLAQQKEFAVRVALGAGRWALVRQTMVQSVTLSVVGGAGALAIGSLAVEAVKTFAPEKYPQLGTVDLDPTVLFATGALAICAGLLAGLAPAFRVMRVNVDENLKEARRSATTGARRHRLLSGLAVAQTALALVLVTGSVLMFRTLERLLTADPGFRANHVVSMELTLAGPRYARSPVIGFIRELDARLERAHGIEAAGMTSNLPLSGSANSSPFTITGRPDGVGAEQRHADMRMVSAGFFRALGIPLLRGRMFSAGDIDGAPLVCLIDKQLAQQFFGNEDPIGKEISQGRPATIIGMVGSLSHSDIGEAPKATIYYPLEQYPVNSLAIVIRSPQETAAVASIARSVLAELDRHVPVYKVRPLPELVADSLGPQRLAVWILSAFAALALLLALLGIYGVVSYSVTQRRQEMGIRIALGALPSEIVHTVVRQGALLAGIGVAIGLVASTLMTRFLSAMLYQVRAVDPVTIAISVTLLISVGLAASWLPARRAARIDPTQVLRTE